MVTTNPVPVRYTCADVAKLSGLSKHVLRVWEQRYGWPRPRRDAHNGYRVYRMADVENATKMAEYIRQGWSVGQLIHDGIPTWPAKDAVPPKLAHGVPSKLPPVEKPKRVRAKRSKTVVVTSAKDLASVVGVMERDILSDPKKQPVAAEDEDCKRCGADGGDPLICDSCSATFCSKCDTGGKCPSCGEPLP